MQAILVRVGVDHAYGQWNAPVDPASGQFVYVPIPEKVGAGFHPGCERPYAAVVPAIEAFAQETGMPIMLPYHFAKRSMQLDPDFEYLTYGDVASRQRRPCLRCSSKEREDSSVRLRVRSTAHLNPLERIITRCRVLFQNRNIAERAPEKIIPAFSNKVAHTVEDGQFKITPLRLSGRARLGSTGSRLGSLLRGAAR